MALHIRSYRAPCSCFRKRCPFSCHRNSPWVMSGLRSWTGREFHRWGPAVAKVVTITARWAGTRKVKPIWILLKQEAVSGSGISWAVCKSAPRSGQITTPVPHRSVFYRPDALPDAQPTASKHWRQPWDQVGKSKTFGDNNKGYAVDA